MLGEDPRPHQPRQPLSACQDTAPHEVRKGPQRDESLSSGLRQGRQMAPRPACVADAVLLRAPGPVI